MPVKTNAALLFYLLLSWCANAQVIPAAPGKVLLLPSYFLADSTMNNLGVVSIKPGNGTSLAGFERQLYLAQVKVAEMGGNIFQIRTIKDKRQSDRYAISGTAYRTTKPDSLLAVMKASKLQTRGGDQYACITIYRPNYMHAHNDELSFDIFINDTMKLALKADMRYIIRTTRAGRITVATKDKRFIQNLDLNITPGSNYYIRGYVNFPRSGKSVSTVGTAYRLTGYTPYMEQVTDLQGEQESDLITKAVIVKTLH